MKYKIIQGNNIEVLKTYPDNHFDSIVTDPPYGLSFLGKDWDKNTGAVETWEQCLRVLKPGRHLLAFSAARTYHRLASNLEDCGFEIRDQIMWIYASGFPKAQDMGKAIQKRIGINSTTSKVLKQQGGFNNWSDTNEDKNNQRENQTIREVICTSPDAKQWAGWKQALKPAHEPIVLCRKPFKGSCVDNVLEYGTGAMNIDDNRIKYNEGEETHQQNIRTGQANATNNTLPFTNIKTKVDTTVLDGRYPSNIIGEISEKQEAFFNPEYDKNYFYSGKITRGERHIGYQLEEVSGNHFIDSCIKKDRTIPKRLSPLCAPGEKRNITERMVQPEYDKNYFYSGKITRGERHIGHDIPEAIFGKNKGCYDENGQHYAVELNKRSAGNNHPTVKPAALMSWLIKLITPPGGKILDPFNGSGSTGMAATDNDFDYTGIELDQDYVDISIKRIEAWSHRNDPDNEYLNLFNE